MIVYYSSNSENTHKFLLKSGLEGIRIPVSPKNNMPDVSVPYFLIVPTYAGDDGRGAVPKQVIKFLNNPKHRSLLKGVIGAGNRNFGELFGFSADVISAKCGVPVIHKFELAGTQADIEIVKERIAHTWKTSKNITH